MNFEKNMITPIGECEIDNVNGGVGIALGVLGAVGALIYIGEVLHDFYCEDHK